MGYTFAPMKEKTSRHQNFRALAAAINYFSSINYNCFLPMQDLSRFNLAIESDGRLFRINVISTSYKTKFGVYRVSLKTFGGHGSGERVRLFDSTHQDFVFIHTSNDQKFLIPSEEVSPKHALSLGAYAKYEIFQISSAVEQRTVNPLVASSNLASGDL